MQDKTYKINFFLEDGRTQSVEFAVPSGKDGKDGKDGADGYTPQKGVDYFDGKDGKDGKDGADGTDATVTATNIKNALGYTPSNEQTVTQLSGDIVDLQKNKAGVIIEKASGESPLCIRDTVEAPLSIKMYGKSVQETYSGKNLLDLSSATNGTHLNVTWTIQDGYVKANGTASGYSSISIDLELKAGTYSLNGRKSADSPLTYAIVVVRADGSTVNHYDTFTVDGTETSIKARFQVSAGNTATNIVLYPMLNEGDTVLPWESYTGGIPSPNPSYPQEIKSVVVSEVRVHGKNLINQPCVQAGDALKHWLKAGTYTVSRDASESAGKTWYFRAQSADGTIITKRAIDVSISSITSNEAWYYGGSSTTNYCFTLKEDCYVTIGSLDGSGTTYLMLVEGGEPAEYEPYTENTATLSQPIALHGIGDVMDELTPDGVVRKFEKVVFDGSDDEGWDIITTNTIRFHTGMLIGTILAPNANDKQGNMLSDSFVNTTANSTYLGYDGISVDKSGRIFIKYDAITSLEEWKAHLAENPITVLYELAEPITEPLPEADQIALRDLHSYDGVTNVMCDAEIVPTIEAECALDTKRYIDRKFAELATALV